MPLQEGGVHPISFIRFGAPQNQNRTRFPNATMLDQTPFGLTQPADIMEALAWDSIGKTHTLKVLRPEAGAYREVDPAIVPAKPRKN